jgi:putative tryptophan/tyrosine transport system substrate-binding protein
VRRRAVIGLAAGAALWPFSAWAQPPDGMRRVGLLMAYAENDPEGRQRVSALRGALRESGWIDGQNLRLELRWHAGDPERAQALARDLAGMDLDAIVVNGTPALTAIRRLTTTIPVVFVIVTDPVGAGHVQSLSRPGGNVTGFSTFEPEIGAKWLELLKEIALHVTRVGILTDPALRGFSALLSTIESLAPSFDLQPTVVPGQDGPSVERMIEAFAQQPNGGLIVFPTPINAVQRQTIYSLSARYRLPAVYPFAFHARGGGLMAYGFNAVDLFRRAATYVDRIFRGEKSGELPVQAPVQFELVVNLKAAKTLGLTVPDSLLLQADEVVE